MRRSDVARGNRGTDLRCSARGSCACRWCGPDAEQHVYIGGVALALHDPAGTFWEMFASRRLRLGGLDTKTQRLVLASLTGLGSMGALLGASWVGLAPPGGSYNVPGVPDPVPRAIALVAYPTLAAAAAAIAAGACDSQRRYARLIVLFVGLLGALMAVTTARSHALLDDYREIVPGRELALSWLVDGAIAATWATLGCALIVALAPRWLARRMGALYPAFAAAPFLAGIAVYGVAAIESFRGPSISLVGRTPEAVVAGGVIALVTTVGFWVTAAFLWQAALAARGACDLGERFAVRLGSRPRAVLAIIACKLVCLVVGLAGLLPTALAGDTEHWVSARADGAFAWAYAGALAVAAAIWFGRTREPLTMAGALPATAALCAGLALAVTVAALAVLAFSTVVALAPGSGTATTLAVIANVAGDQILITQVLTVLVATTLGAVLVFTRRGPPGARTMLLLFGLWATPRTINVAWDVLTGRETSFGRVELVTLDTTLTIAALVVVSTPRLRARADLPLVLAVVVVSAAIAHSGWLISTLLSERATFYAALLFAPLYQFLFASRALSAAGPDRASRTLLATGSATAVIALVTVQESVGFAGPGINDFQSLAPLLLTVPLAGVLLASRTSGRRRSAYAST